MKKSILLILFIFISTISFGQKRISLTTASKTNFEVQSVRNDGFIIENSIAELVLNPVHLERGSFTTLDVDGMYKIFEEGMPNIPVISKLIEVPQGASVELQVVSYDEEIIQLSDYSLLDQIMPALRSQSKSESRTPFVMNETVYQMDEYINTKIAVYKESGQLRATRLGNVVITPIQYNPVRNTLRVLNNLVVEVNFVNADYDATTALKTKYNTIYHNDMMSGMLINYNKEVDRELITQAPTHLVIVSDPMFEDQLTPFIEWKIKKGFQVTVAYTNVIGTSTSAIKSYLQGIYEGDNPMSFVLFVGDVQQIPAWDTGSHVTDLRYCEYTGDNLPEVYYGRFSAQNTNQLQPQIDKTLMYEQYTMSDPSYLSEVFLVAGDDSSHEMTYGNGQIWYGDNYYFNEDHNINAHTYLQPLDNGAMHGVIIDDINSGMSYVNYTAHCGPSGWSSPSFEVSDVSGLTNNEKYGLWVGNCCLSVKFDENECFGEAALRKANGGAIGDIGGSNSTLWDEDYWWGVGLTSSIVAEPTYNESGSGAYDGLFHDLENEVDNTLSWYPAQGQVNVCGNLAVEASTSTNKQYYWEIYHLMGDPTVTNFIGTPEAMTVTPSPAALMLGMTELSVSSAPYSYVALSQNGVLIGAALSDATGNANISFESDVLGVGEADLVVTCQNKIPYIGTITISPANEPYVVLNSYETSSSADYDTSTTLNVTLENVAESGSGYDADNVQATLSTTDTMVNLTDATENYGTIDAGDTGLINNAFAFDIANNVEDQHQVTFELELSDSDSHVWNTSMVVTLNAPEFSIGTMNIDDSSGDADGILDAGETADIRITTTNVGHASVSNVIGTIESTSDAFTINSATTSPITMSMGDVQELVFNVTANDDAVDGTEVTIVYTVTGGNEGQYSNTDSFNFTIGFIPEYCAAGAETVDEFIEHVQFATIDNSSAVGPTYSDYTSISTDIVQGESYPITITNGLHYSGDQMGCWIDWNYDGDFDDADETINITYSDPNGVGTVTVPSDARLGATRMRLRVMYSGAVLPCGDASYGEVEDYTVNVVQNIGTTAFGIDNIKVYPNPSQGSFTVDFGEVNSDYSFKLVVSNLNGQKVYQETTTDDSLQVSLPNVSGVYFLRVESGHQVLNRKIIVE